MDTFDVEWDGAARAAGYGVLRPESQRPLGGGLAALHEPERAVEATSWAVGSRGAVALCAHHGAARRQGHPSLLGRRRATERIEAEDGNRGCTAILRHAAAAAERAVGSRLRHDDQASLRPPGGGGCELQPEEAGPSLARLPCVPDGGHAPCAGPPGKPPGALAAPCQGRQGLGQRGQHGVVRGGGSDYLFKLREGSAPACRIA